MMDRPTPTSTAHGAPPSTDAPPPAEHGRSAINTFETIISRASTPILSRPADGDKHPAPSSSPAPASTTKLGIHRKAPFASNLPHSRDPSAPGAAAASDDRRYRPRTFSYISLLPFPAEPQAARDEALDGILRQLYIAIKAEDFSLGAMFWSRQLQNWLHLKFEMPRTLRATLVKMFYHLALAQGLDPSISDRFVSMVVELTRKYHYLKPGDLSLDWRPLWKEFKALVLPYEVAPHMNGRRKPHKQLWKLCLHSHTYFDPRDRKEMLDEFLPYFSTSDLSNAYIVVGLINAFLPTAPAPRDCPASRPEDFLPTLFHLWSLVSRSRVFDNFFIDFLGRLTRDFCKCEDAIFTEYGILTKEQSDHVFTAILRLTEIPVGQADSPYSSVDYAMGSGAFLEKDKKKYPVACFVARFVVSSLSGLCDTKTESALSSLEGLIESIETFFHPSNQGGWTAMLGQLTHYLVDFFVLRWNREQSGELDVPQERRITPELKKRFVLCLRDVSFMGIFCKSSRITHYYYAALHGLAYLEPALIIPGALQRFYPSLQGLVEVHRTTSSLNGLQLLANIISRQKGYRCHMTALLALALPGIDANDLIKTQYTLSFIQSVAYSIPMVSLVKEGEEEQVHDTTLAVQWVQPEMDRMEKEGQDVRLDYDTELTDEQEANILISSTAGLGEFILALLGKVFTLLENLPDSSHLRTGTPEENVINALPSALAPIFASLSDELFDMALDKLCNFVSSHVVHQARDAMAWIINALCKASPEKTLKAFVPMLIVNIRNEIDHNHAASDRSSGTDYLPRDRALVWHVIMLGMVIVHVGADMLKYKDDLLEIAKYMQEKCRGLPTIHISNLVHHMLLTLTRTYPIDHALYEPEVLERGIGVADWGRITTPSELSIRWHRPSPAEIAFAEELFAWQTKSAVEKLDQLMSDNPPVPRKGKNKEWSDEVVRVLHQVRLVISGMATLFDPKRASGKPGENGDGDMTEYAVENDSDPLAEVAEDEEMRPNYHYEAGYVLQPEDPVYEHLHVLREEVGQLLSKTHAFLTANQEDDVACFTALYTAYRTWITDVGVERSAHPLERHLRLYCAHIAPFKVSGLRKQYPRPLLVNRAEAYHIQRVKHNASCRSKGPLDRQLLLDLAASCLSSYAEVRRVAQSVQDSSLKSLVGGRPLVIPVVIDKFRQAIEAEDHDKIKGGLYTLLFTSLTKTISKDWRFAPEVVRLYIKTAGIDKQSIQALGTRSLVSVMEAARPLDTMILVDQSVIGAIKTDEEDCSELIRSRHDFIVQRRERVQSLKSELGLELTEQAKEAHWKIASRCAILASSLCVRFFNIAPPEFVEFVTRGVNDPHPGLRATHIVAFTSIFTAIDVRATYNHSYKNYLLGEDERHLRIEVPVEKGDAEFTQRYMASFDRPDDAEYFVDSDHPGWLVWGKNFVAYRASPPLFRNYDEVESSIRGLIGGLLTRDWFKQCFDYLKQEPRDTTNDRFRTTNLYLLMHSFDLMHFGLTAITFDEIQEMIKEVYEDGSDKHQHRATAEILAALLVSTIKNPRECRDKVWAFAAPLMIRVMLEDLTPENLQYWLACLHVVTDGKDPRRYHELERALRANRIDMSSNAAFKDSSKIMLLDTVITEAGWHFQGDGPVLEDMLAHLEHPYKSVRESVGRCIATIYRTRYHESFENVDTLMAKNKEASSSLGLRPYQPTLEFSRTIRGVFDRLEKWRHEREPGQQTPSAYTQGSKTVLVWLDTMLSSQECTQLASFFPEPFIQQLLHMMDVKEDPELLQLAYHVYRHIPNIPLREGEDEAVIASLIRIGRSAPSWHQRLRALINLQVIYFRRLFLTKTETRDLCFEAVGDMLADQQLEVRTYASNTLAGMIRCLPRRIRDPAIDRLKERFFAELKANPMPQRRRPGLPAIPFSPATATPANWLPTRAPGTGTGTATPPLPTSGDGTPADVQAQIVRRHAAVLGLGALIEAFPYATPPPRWMPEVLATLASRAASDPGVVGKATKAILSDFKKTRQDSWNVDQKYFTSEQLEDLEGVLWKSYFA